MSSGTSAVFKVLKVELWGVGHRGIRLGTLFSMTQWQPLPWERLDFSARNTTERPGHCYFK